MGLGQFAYANYLYWRLFSNLSPRPPSLNKGRGSVAKRGALPLSKISSPSPSQEEGDKEGEVNKQSNVV